MVLEFAVIEPDDRLRQIKIGLHKAFCYYSCDFMRGPLQSSIRQRPTLLIDFLLLLYIAGIKLTPDQIAGRVLLNS